MIHLGIDASNLRQGGGITHLVELLRSFDPENSTIKKITIWCSAILKPMLPREDWLIIRTDIWLDKNCLYRFLGQQFFLSRLMQLAGCNVGFFPGGIIPIKMGLPAITMSQNMLPFNLQQAMLFRLSNSVFWKLLLLRLVQSVSFKRATGIIFLSQYAQVSINKFLTLKAPQALIPHGVGARFLKSPREQRPAHKICFGNPFKFIYISILMPYKHQIEVANAIGRLRQAGMPIACQFIGPAWGWYGDLFQKEIAKLDPQGEFLIYSGEMKHLALEAAYHLADGFIFASSCENLPNILIEAMSSGLPIACSNTSPMPEVLGEAGFYFQPDDPDSISACIRGMVERPQERLIKAKLAFNASRQYSWGSCSSATFRFIEVVT